jgi:hypothetical protein
MGTKDRTYGATDTDKDVDRDTEGHDWRRTYPLPPNVEGGGSQPSDFLRDDGDTEGHQIDGPDGVMPKPGPGEHRVDGDDDKDTEGHYQLRRRPGEGGE